MPDQAIIDALIGSYRELNHLIRGASFSTGAVEGAKGAGDTTVPGILYMMRDRELNASQAIKSMLLGQDVRDDDEAAYLSEQQVAAGTSPNILLSQFGTAREATLSLIRDLPDEEWDKTHDTPRGNMTLRQYLQTLVDRDRERVEQIQQLMSKTTA